MIKMKEYYDFIYMHALFDRNFLLRYRVEELPVTPE